MGPSHIVPGARLCVGHLGNKEALPEKPVQNLEMGGQPIGFILSGQSRSGE